MFCFTFLWLERCFWLFVWVFLTSFIFCFFYVMLNFLFLVEHIFWRGRYLNKKIKLFICAAHILYLYTVMDSQQTCFNKCCELGISKNRKKMIFFSGNPHTVSEKNPWFVRTSSPSICRSKWGQGSGVPDRNPPPLENLFFKKNNIVILPKITPLPAKQFIHLIPAWEKFLNSRMPLFGRRIPFVHTLIKHTGSYLPTPVSWR